MSDITKESDLDFDQHIEINGDKAYMMNPIYDGQGIIIQQSLVMEKEGFQKMYEEWIVKEGLDRRIL